MPLQALSGHHSGHEADVLDRQNHDIAGSRFGLSDRGRQQQEFLGRDLRAQGRRFSSNRITCLSALVGYLDPCL
jgi:hypothetical protein